MNLDKVSENSYIPSFIKNRTPEQHCRAELARYYSGDTLEERVAHTLNYFRVIGDIKEYDFCEEYGDYFEMDKTITRQVRLVWKKRLPLQ